MSQENVERLRTAFEAFLAGKSDFGTELLHPEVEWDATELTAPDITGMHHGPEGVREFWRQWLAAWETVQFDYELVETGDSVVALMDQRMRGRSTHMDVPFGKYAQVYTFSDGLIVHWKGFMSQADALRSVRLSARD